MSTPGVWSQEDLDKILSTYGAFVCVSLLFALLLPSALHRRHAFPSDMKLTDGLAATQRRAVWHGHAKGVGKYREGRNAAQDSCEFCY